MKLAILTQYYPPETGAPQNRLSNLAGHLRGAGHQVEVLTALPSYPGDEVFPAYAGRAPMVEELDGVRVARVNLYVPRRKTFTRRLANYLSFAAGALRHGGRLLGRADVLLMESPPLFLALAGVPLARRLGARLVVNVSDLWPASAVDLGVVRPGLGLRAAEALEAWMYRRADLVTGQTDHIVDDIRRRFPDRPVALYPNGVNVAAYTGPLDRAGLRAEFGWPDGRFVVGYTGVLGLSQALDQVLDAAALLRDRADVGFAIFGDGQVRERLERRVRDERLDAVVVHARQPRERMPHVQAALDAGLVPLARGGVFEGARPSKMFEIMAAGRPVVLCARGEAVRIVEGPADGPCGVAVPPEEPAALAAALRCLADDRAAAAAMGERGRRHVFARFDRAAIARDLERLLSDLAARPRGERA